MSVNDQKVTINMARAIDILELRAAAQGAKEAVYRTAERTETTENIRNKAMKITYETCSKLYPEMEDSDIFDAVFRCFYKPIDDIEDI